MTRKTERTVTGGLVFFCIFSLLVKYGIYAAAVLAIFVTARIIKFGE